jgi:hypothetical protein
MGWCSATEIFDPLVEAVLSDEPLDKHAFIKKLIEVLEANDWDCQQDSRYFDHPAVKAAFKELHPWWFKETS